jgi:acetylornithine deacetylase/succinyl-diaminopimelate desuccinylase-like protein
VGEVKGWIAKKGRGFLPADEEAARMHVKMDDNECVLVEIIQPRSVPWHRMYFGICRAIGQNQDPPRDESSIDHELRVRAGHFDVLFVGKDEGLEKLARMVDSVVTTIRTNLSGAERLAKVIDAIAIALHERAEKKEVRVPKRIAFAKLTADQWADLWPSLELAIRETYGEEYIGESQRTGTW